MIAYLIGDPIGSHRVNLNRVPNRGRIAPIGSVRFVSFNYVGHFAIPSHLARGATMR